jgi:hypothetical protein
MPAMRTQIYLTADQRQRIDELADAEGVTMAEVVRRALDSYLVTGQAGASSVLTRTFGAAPEAQHPDRADWARGQRPG